MAELARAQTDTAARLEAMIGMLARGQTQLQHAVNERLDSVSHRLGDSLEKTKLSTTENLQKLNERLAVIDSAQKNITDARHPGDLAARRARQQAIARRLRPGAHGIDRARWPAEGLPTNSNTRCRTSMRPDCVVFMPDKRPLVIDAKFPLEAVTAYRDAKTDDERQAAPRAAARRRQQARQRYRGKISHSRRNPGDGVDVRAVGIGLCRTARRFR